MSGSRHSQIESHHAPPAPGLHTDERRRVPFPHIAGAARFPSTELSEQSSPWGSHTEEAIFTARRRKRRSLPPDQFGRRRFELCSSPRSNVLDKAPTSRLS